MLGGGFAHTKVIPNAEIYKKEADLWFIMKIIPS